MSHTTQRSHALSGQGERTGDVPRWVSTVAVAGTMVIAAAALWLSWTALTDLAVSSGISPDRAWAWPILVDGLLIVGTVAVVASEQARRFAWFVVTAAAFVAISGNALHAFSSSPDVPSVLAACVSGVPAVALLASTHLTALLARPGRHNATTHAPRVAGMTRPRAVRPQNPTRKEPADGRGWNREHAQAHVRRLRAAGWSYATIAQRVGVHPSTVGRWLALTPDAVHDNVNGQRPSDEDAAG